MLKIALLSLMFVGLHADDWDDEEDSGPVIAGMVDTAQIEKEIRMVWTSSENKLSRYNLSFTRNKLKLNKNGDITMFLTTNRDRIDSDDIFTFVKFDTTQDKEKKYECAVTDTQTEDKMCKLPFYTSDAVGSALFGTLAGIATGGISKKFDKGRFANFIINNEEDVIHIIDSIKNYNIPPHGGPQPKKKESIAIVIPQAEPRKMEVMVPKAVPVVAATSKDVGFDKHRVSNNTNNFIEDYCQTEWVQMYGEQYPPPRSMEELKIELAESGSQITVKSQKLELYKYNTDIESSAGIPGFSFTSNNGKSIKLYKNGDLFVIEGGIETLKAKCRPVEI